MRMSPVPKGVDDNRVHDRSGAMHPSILVWRDTWLRSSETFTRNQFTALTAFRGLAVGLHPTHSALSSTDDVSLARRPGLGSHVIRIVLATTGRSRTLRSLTTKNGIDIIHGHFASDTWVIRRFARRERIPLVVTLHGMDVTSWPRGRGRSALQATSAWWRRRNIRLLFRDSSAIVAVSHHIAGRAQELGAPGDKLHVRYVGVPVTARAARQDRAGVVFVGRLVEKKGVSDLLQAVALMPPHLRSIPVRIVGDGPLRRPLETLAAQLELDVTFCGSLPPAGTREELERAAIFCAPSKRAADGDEEGFGMVFLEAGLAELPVVSYVHGGVPEAVEDGVTGVLVPEGDIPALSEALADLLSDPGRRSELARQGRRRVEERFDIRTCTTELESLLASLIESRSRPRDT